MSYRQIAKFLEVHGTPTPFMPSVERQLPRLQAINGLREGYKRENRDRNSKETEADGQAQASIQGIHREFLAQRILGYRVAYEI